MIEVPTHVMACCDRCWECGKNIIFGFLTAHEVARHQKDLAELSEEDKRHVELLRSCISFDGKDFEECDCSCHREDGGMHFH